MYVYEKHEHNTIVDECTRILLTTDTGETISTFGDYHHVTDPQRVGGRSLQCSSEVVDDVVVLVDFQDGLKLSVGEDAETNLDAQIGLFTR